jgi:hypothetical protein
MVKERNAAISLRWFALVGVILGALVSAGPEAQAQNQSGAWEAAPPPQEHVLVSDLVAAGIVVPGSPVSASPPVAPTAEAARPQPQGPISPSGVVGAAPQVLTQTPHDPAAAGVVQ